MEVIFSNFEPRSMRKPNNEIRRIPVSPRKPRTEQMPPAATGDNYVKGIRYFSKVLNRYVELYSIWDLDQVELNKLWTECRVIGDSWSPNLNPNRKATARLLSAMCEYTARKYLA